MRIPSTIILIFIIHTSCHSLEFSRKKDDETLKTVVFGKHYFLVNNETGEFFNVEDSVFISYFKDIVSLKIPVPDYEMKVKYGDTLEYIIDDNKPLKINYYYCVRRRNSKVGCFYTFKDNYKSSEIVNSDSLFAKYLPVFPLIASSDSYELFNSYRDDGKFFEKYLLKTKTDLSFPDTILLEYDKEYLDIPFSFSKDKDSSRHSKLVHISSSYRDTNIVEQKLHLPKRAINFFIRKEIGDPDTILNRIVKEYKL